MSGRRRSPVVVLVVGAVVTALVVGAVLVRAGDPGSTEDEAAATGARGVGPDLERNDASDRSATPGASADTDPVDAAISHVTASQEWLYLTDDELDAAIRSVTTLASADRLAAEAVAEVAIARDRLAGSSGRVWWIVHPLAWQVDHQAGDSARVSVWVVTILSAVDVAAPQSEFATVTVDLEFVVGEWLVDDVLETPGPTPMTGPMDLPWDAVPFDDALDGFTRIGADVDR